MKKLCLVLLLVVSACSNSSHAQPSEMLSGRYLFRSQGWVQNHYAFFEAGIVTFQPEGRYLVESTYNSNGMVKHVSVEGTYVLHGDIGTSESLGDSAVFYVSKDRTLIYAVSTNQDSTWLVEAHKSED